MNDRRETERLLATVALGLAEAVHAGRMAPDVAADLFFVDAFLLHDKSQDIDPRLLEALHAGSELEDVATLAPAGMDEALSKIRSNALAVLGAEPADARPVTVRWIHASR